MGEAGEAGEAGDAGEVGEADEADKDGNALIFISKARRPSVSDTQVSESGHQESCYSTHYHMPFV